MMPRARQSPRVDPAIELRVRLERVLVSPPPADERARAERAIRAVETLPAFESCG